MNKWLVAEISQPAKNRLSKPTNQLTAYGLQLIAPPSYDFYPNNSLDYSPEAVAGCAADAY